MNVKEEIETKNEADTMIHTTEKVLSDYKDKIDEETKEKVTNALKNLRKTVRENDAEEIKNKMDHLQKVLQEFGTKIYQQAIEHSNRKVRKEK